MTNVSESLPEGARNGTLLIYTGEVHRSGRTVSVTSEPLHLADKVPANLHTLFVGINPAIRSAQLGHYYAHPTNMFWRLLSQTQVTPRPVTADDDDWMVRHGFGFTDVAKRPTANAGELAQHEFAAARLRLEDLVRSRRPKTIVFVSKRAARAFLQVGNVPVVYGRHTTDFHGATVWFLPSTSGQSFADTSYDQKVDEFRKLADHIHTYHAWTEDKWPSRSSAESPGWAKRLLWTLFGRRDPSSTSAP